MKIDIRVPEAGESITQVELARWLVGDGDYVVKDQEIAEIDSDKATLTINAEASGKIKIMVEEGSTVEPKKIIGQIDTNSEQPTAKSQQPTAKSQKPTAKSQQPTAKSQKPKAKSQQPKANSQQPKTNSQQPTAITFSPQAKKFLEEVGISPDLTSIRPGSKRITKKDILTAIASRQGSTPTGAGNASRQDNTPGMANVNKDPVAEITWAGTRHEDRKKMSTLRRKVAERLVAVRNQTAMLTTFNEADMSAIIELRRKYQEQFTERHGFKLGFMSFFVKAVTEAIPFFPQVNGYIDGQDLVIPAYADVGIAVSTPKGLMVPVIRNAEQQSIPELENNINTLAEKAREGRITIEELSGGTISITNGGVFGSMLSTPIINPPQSAILGMHNIIERPVAINGRVEIRPMMYLALSYDHRVIDGRESVGFLVKVKELIEQPAKMLFQGKDPMATLLGLR